MKFLTVFFVTALLLAGCKQPLTRVQEGNRTQTLHVTNGTDPEDIDPHIVTGVPEHHIITSIIEGLVSEDPKDLHPIPGMAESWESNDDQTVWTFKLRENAKWTSGDPVTANDFVQSFERILNPKLGSKYSYMLFVMKGAEDYNTGKITDFSEVGAKALNDRTLEITLNDPTPYFLSLLNHYTWFPVHIPTVEKHGERYAPGGNPWTQPGNFVGNGPFRLKEWIVNDKLVVERNPDYWDAANVKLNEIHFYGIVSADTQEKFFRGDQMHNSYQIPPVKIETYKKNNPELLTITPHLACYFYRFNTQKKPLDNKLVRKALAMAIDRDSIVKNVTQGGQMPARFFTPPGVAGYQNSDRFEENIEEAKKMLVEAGYENPADMPTVEILYNTDENHRAIAEAIQEMWSKNLGIKSELVNQEWKTYLDRQRRLDYQVSRAGWTGDYPDPNTFLDMWTSFSQQNQTGWSNEKYDELIRNAARTKDVAERLKVFHEAEDLLMDEMPVMPIYIYTRVYLKKPSVKGWYPTILDHHPWKHIELEAAAE